MNNKLVKTLALGLTTVLCAGVLSSCGNSYDYNYTLSDYVKLGEYKGLTLSAEAVENSVQSTIDSLLSDNAETKDITDRAVAAGDKVNIDYAGTIDGEAFTGGTAAAQELTLGSSGYIDGFDDGIIGMSIGDNKTIEVTFPEDYSNADVAGKDA
ncbi:MAG: FKBP-type peptidyl-prolyl cis-trans isomerase, partial [Eubacteriales bacterium]